MAVCQVWDVQKRPAEKVLQYVMNPEKTISHEGENCRLVTGINVSTETARAAAREFRAVRKQYNNHSKNNCFHGIQSFKPGEVSEDGAHAIGVELAKEMWGDRFQVVVSTHVDREHIHNHFVINNISFIDGKAFYDNKANLHRLREVSDRLCREVGLSVIEDKQYAGRSYPLWLSDKAFESGKLTELEKQMWHMIREGKSHDGTRKHIIPESHNVTREHIIPESHNVTRDKETSECESQEYSFVKIESHSVTPTVVTDDFKVTQCDAEKKSHDVTPGNPQINRRVLVRHAIDMAIENSMTLTEFAEEMNKLGYKVCLDPNHRYWTVQHKSWNRSMRMYRLGDGYSNKAISRRVYANENFTISDVKKTRVHPVKTVRPRKKLHGYRALYYRYLYLFGKLPKNEKRFYSALRNPRLREDISNINKMSERAKVLAKYRIDTTAELSEVLARIKNEMNNKSLNRSGKKRLEYELNQLLKVQEEAEEIKIKMRKEKQIGTHSSHRVTQEKIEL